jgi:23S rRNA (adenine2030-N6)-methyltransferase
MLAYRHAFHAGNHADVLKHVVLTQVLQYMNGKDRPYRLIDTHAGAGGYSLRGNFAQKKGEFEQGIGRLWSRSDLPGPVADYVQRVRQFNPDGRLDQYPGSPAFGQMLLRKQDQLRLFELHPTDYRILASFLGDAKRTQVAQADGFAALKGELPPSTRRAVVLMDPSYELAADYGKLVASLRDALTRFAEGVYMVWYPQVQRLEAAQLPKRLQALAPKGWLHVRLTVQQADAQGFGLAGSGVFVYNPPFTLHKTLLDIMPFLVDVLGQYAQANYLVEQQPA